MKKILSLLLVVLFVTVVFQVIQVRAEEPMLNADDVIKSVDPDVITKAQFKEYFKTIEGKKVKGEGSVVNILPGSSNHYRITILTHASEPEKGYNVVLYTSQDARSELKNGDKIFFEGEISRVNPYRGANLDIHGTYKQAEQKP